MDRGSDGQTNLSMDGIMGKPTDTPTDGPADKACYRVSNTRLTRPSRPIRCDVWITNYVWNDVWTTNEVWIANYAWTANEVWIANDAWTANEVWIANECVTQPTTYDQLDTAS